MKTHTLTSKDKDYLVWFADIKARIRGTQIRAALAANAVLIRFYHDLGRMIVEKQRQTRWGDKLVERLAKDLRAEFPDMRGFSRGNLLYCKRFYNFFQPSGGGETAIVPQVVEQLEKPVKSLAKPQVAIIQQTGGQIDGMARPEFLETVVFNIPWGHIRIVIEKVKDFPTAAFYFTQALENGWSRDILALQIKGGLHQRQGRAITNFVATLPAPISDLAQQTLKDPYIFDFMSLTSTYREKDIENQLVQHLTKFMLELGKGFAFVGQQYHLEVAQIPFKSFGKDLESVLGVTKTEKHRKPQHILFQYAEKKIAADKLKSFVILSQNPSPRM